MRWICCLLLCYASAAIGKICEIYHFDEIRDYLHPGMLVVLDIDNTLLMPIQELGSDQWFHHRLDRYIQGGCSLQDALEYALSEWEGVQNLSIMTSPECETPSLIDRLQQHWTVMGLTTRGLALATRTVHQLQSVGIHLTKHTVAEDDIPLLNPRLILYRKGILFTSGTHKGQALLKLLDAIGYKPQSILFVNDKASHLREVEVACEAHHIPFTGLRYGFLDEKVRNFRPDIAAVQFEQFSQILSDEEAQKILNTRRECG